MIRIAQEKDLEDILDIHRAAFGEEDEAELVKNLLDDNTAKPVLSLIGFQEEEPSGHILFTKCTVGDTGLSAYLLAPLAVHPDFQFKGTGKRLIKEGFRQLGKQGVDLIFVLGEPEYYMRAGFMKDAGFKGFQAPHPIPAKHANAWMVRSFSDALRVGKVSVADAISAREYWAE